MQLLQLIKNNILDCMEIMYKIYIEISGANFKIETRNVAIITLATDSQPQ